MTASTLDNSSLRSDDGSGPVRTAGPISVAELTAAVEAGTVHHVLLVTPDNAGRALGERVVAREFIRHIDSPLSYRLPLMLWAIDVEQGFRDNLDHIGGMSEGVPDIFIKPDLGTIRLLPWMPGDAVIICDPTFEDGSPVPFAPRQILRTQLDGLAEQGVSLQAATELEFYLFEESYEHGWRTGYTDLTPSSRYHAAYDPLATVSTEPFMKAVTSQMEAAGIELEGWSNEYGHGQQEINFRHTDAMEMADRHFLYKFGVKAIAARMGKAVTFMAKWDINEDGNSCHVHVSLWDRDGTQSLGDDPRFGAFVAGMALRAREGALLIAPNINSYRRFKPNSFAPTVVAVGDNNRTCSLRVVGSASSRRVENRTPGADANPYVVLAAIACSGAEGIKTGLDMPDFCSGDVYAREDLPTVPTSLHEALDLFAASDALKTGLGEDVHRHLLGVAREEELIFLTEIVTDWERRRLFERI